ncbi:MAG: Zn-dependent protease [Planctomycetes bacterium RBG_16_59_8]|nr:MAG: Zn-dependent protease [Planctomycetes bacterium RBG_16_59_8]
MKDLLKDVAARQGGWLELRYHRKAQNTFDVRKGRVDVSNSRTRAGVGVRVLIDGSWGFAATDDLSRVGIEKALESARACARQLRAVQKERVPALPPVAGVEREVVVEGYRELERMPLADKLARTVDLGAKVAATSSMIQSTTSRYNEIFEEKVIVTTDGACVSMKLARAEFGLSAVAEKDGQQAVGRNNFGVTGDWTCLFNHPRAENLVEKTGKTAVDLLSAPHVDGGKHTVILGPAMVGILSHEAIGHTVEADFVQSGSVAAGKIGQRVGSDLVTLCDSGRSEHAPFAGGSIPFDDEGVPTGNTVIIKNGLLSSYLHNRESAARFGVEPTGNARAWEYADEPLIRMRNTYIAPGTQSLEEIIASTKEGYLIEVPGSGQADATGEFMFGAGYAVEIRDGKLGAIRRELTISGVAFDVLQTVDAVSREFRWDLGSGYCGKGQLAKVDAGGPYIRCRLPLGGRKSS